VHFFCMSFFENVVLFCRSLFIYLQVSIFNLGLDCRSVLSACLPAGGARVRTQFCCVLFHLLCALRTPVHLFVYIIRNVKEMYS